MYIKIAMLFFLSALMTSCVSQKEVTYFQAKDPKKDLEQIVALEKFVAKIQPGDILGVMVNSLSPEANLMFNPYSAIQTRQLPMISTVAMPPATGFLVDEAGTISLPLAGKLSIGGMSTKEANDFITQKLEQFLVQPTVNVRILNYKISVLGEVNRPAVYTIANEKVTLPEALCMAGDLTIFGKRNNVLIIRDVAGKKEFARVDMTQRDVFTSPYYYLMPNDVVYVEPQKGRLTATDRTVQLAPIFISALTLIAILTTSILR
ncbi:MAG: polysaccharide biosynthesis/export family protein [Bacteroidetes bacterium]|nr:polysaccharide biosynthesis/export family protein [Bacteroidota bacterium]